jgi:hypothetical protein
MDCFECEVRHTMCVFGCTTACRSAYITCFLELNTLITWLLAIHPHFQYTTTFIMAASSSPASALPTAWLAPPPGLLSSANKATIEPASIAVSAVIAAFVIIFVFLIFNRKKRKYVDDFTKPADAEEAPRRLEISRPVAIDTVNNRAARPAFSSTPSRASTHWPVTQPSFQIQEPRQALKDDVHRPRPTELADAPARGPGYPYQQRPPIQQFNETHQAPLNQRYNNYRQISITHNKPNIPQSPVELEVRQSALTYGSAPAHQYNMFDHRPPTQQHIDIHRGEPPMTRLQPPRAQYVKNDFADDSTVMGDEADTTTLHSDSDSEDGGSVVETSFVPLRESEVGLHGDHWKAGRA